MAMFLYCLTPWNDPRRLAHYRIDLQRYMRRQRIAIVDRDDRAADGLSQAVVMLRKAIRRIEKQETK